MAEECFIDGQNAWRRRSHCELGLVISSTS